MPGNWFVEKKFAVTSNACNFAVCKRSLSPLTAFHPAVKALWQSDLQDILIIYI